MKKEEVKKFAQDIDRSCDQDVGLTSYCIEHLNSYVDLKEARSEKYKYFNIYFNTFNEAVSFQQHVFRNLHSNFRYCNYMWFSPTFMERRVFDKWSKILNSEGKFEWKHIKPRISLYSGKGQILVGSGDDKFTVYIRDPFTDEKIETLEQLKECATAEGRKKFWINLSGNTKKLSNDRKRVLPEARERNNQTRRRRNSDRMSEENGSDSSSTL